MQYIKQYATSKIAILESQIESATETFLSDPPNAIRFNFHLDIAIYTERLNWYKWLLEIDEINIKKLIIYNIGSAMYPKDDNIKLLVIRHKLADLFHFADEMKIDLGEMEEFRSYLIFA